MYTVPEIRMRILELVAQGRDCFPPRQLTNQADHLFEWVYKDIPLPNEVEVSSKLDYIIKQNIGIMNKQEKFDSMIGRLNETTNGLADSVKDIGEDYQKLLKEVQEDNVSDESIDKAEENIAKIEGMVATLKSIGAQVENPVPEQPPVDEPPVEGGTTEG